MGTILLFGKVKNRARAISKELESVGYEVIMTSSLAPSVAILAAEPVDAIMIDLFFGIRESDSIISRIKSSIRLSQLPLVALIAQGDIDQIDTITGISEVITYPCSPKEMSLRLQLASRGHQGMASEIVIKVGGLVIDPVSYEVTVDGVLVSLTHKEFELLKFLASNQDTVYARPTLVHKIWKHDYDSGMRTVDVHIRRLRAKLGKYSCLITTVRHVGYRFSSQASSVIFS